MADTHSKVNLEDVKDQAPDFGMEAMGSARFARQQLGAQDIGLSVYDMNPGQRVGFGHRHSESEEVYVVVRGSGRFRADDEIFDIGLDDVVYCPPTSMREWESGPDGLRLIAFGGHKDGEDSEMQPGWWTD